MAGKKKHHYVPRFYLKSWTKNNLIYCLQKGVVITANIQNVAAENHFYRLPELTPTDIELIQEIAIKDSSKILQPVHNHLVWMLSLPHAERRKLEISGKAGQKELANVDSAIREVNEDIHTSIEEKFKPYLDAMLQGHAEFFSNPEDVGIFFIGLTTQYLRTNHIKKSEANLGPGKYKALQKITNVLVHIFAMNLAYNLYMNREKYELILLENATDFQFITADQPVINVAAKPIERNPPDDFELYYPLSPSKAMLLIHPSSGHRPNNLSVTPIEAHHYNLLMGAHSYQQIFANTPHELMSIRKELPAFLGCF